MVCDWLLLCDVISWCHNPICSLTGRLNQSVVWVFYCLQQGYISDDVMVSVSVSLPRVHSVSLCGKTTKIQPKLKRSKVTPNPPALSLTRQPLSQEHHGKSLYGTDKNHHDQSPKNKSSLKNCWPGTSYDRWLMKIKQDWSASVHLVNSSQSWPSTCWTTSWHLLQVRSGWRTRLSSQSSRVLLHIQSPSSSSSSRPFGSSSALTAFCRHLWMLVNKRFNLKKRNPQLLRRFLEWLPESMVPCVKVTWVKGYPSQR